MKIAKKVLAVVMAIAMIGCLTAMAFAAPVGKGYLTAEKDGTDITVYLKLKDAIGLQAGKAVITYDPAVVEYQYADYGADAAEVNANCVSSKNGCTALENGEVAGTVEYSLTFTESLGTLADFQSQAKKKSYNFQLDPNDFEYAVFYFTVIDEKAAKATFTLNGEGDVVAAGTTVDVEIAGVPQTTEAPSTNKAPETTEAPATKEAPTKESNPSTGDVKTGDNMALAAAAGVVALAGAAFIISKKRK